MKHIKHAQLELDSGNATEALRIVEDILDLAPNNPDALLIKAKVLDSWGYFDQSLELLQKLSQRNDLSAEAAAVISSRAVDEHDALIFCETTSEGRWFYPLPKAQMWISLLGFAGCALFLFLSPEIIRGEATGQVTNLILLFGLLVLVPWTMLIALHFVGIKKIFVGPDGVQICTRLSRKAIPWSEVSSMSVVALHDELHLQLYGQNKSLLYTFNVSSYKSVVRARRHFVRHVTAYADIVSYVHEPLSALELDDKVGAEKKSA